MQSLPLRVVAPTDFGECRRRQVAHASHVDTPPAARFPSLVQGMQARQRLLTTVIARSRSHSIDLRTQAGQTMAPSAERARKQREEAWSRRGGRDEQQQEADVALQDVEAVEIGAYLGSGGRSMDHPIVLPFSTILADGVCTITTPHTQRRRRRRPPPPPPPRLGRANAAP